jgi:flagellar biosynthetic protein FliR
MDFSFAEALIAFYYSLDTYMVIFARMAGFMVIVPVFTGRSIPMQSKVAFAFFVALLIGMAGDFSELPSHSGNALAYVGVIVLEFSVGLFVGFAIYLVLTVMYMVGQLVDFQIGFAMVSVFDPISQIQVPITGNLYFLVMTVFFARSGALHHFIEEMANSYSVISMAEAWIYSNHGLMLYLIFQFVFYFELAARISMPVVGVLLLINVVLGVLVKAVPQMNIFVVGMPIKVLVGIFLLFTVLAPSLGMLYNYLFEWAYESLIEITWGMSP